jgi:FMN reductase
MSRKISIVVGNPKPNSRTLQISQMLVRHLFGAEGYTLRVIDLAEHAAELFRWPSAEMSDLNAAVAGSDFAVFASPTYKATYTGLLKAFLDRYPANGLKGLAAVSLMTGADKGHSMAPSAYLSPLLVELGATVPFRAFYFSINEMDRAEEIVEAFARECAATHQSLKRLVTNWPSLGAKGVKERAQ